MLVNGLLLVSTLGIVYPLSISLCVCMREIKSVCERGGEGERERERERERREGEMYACTCTHTHTHIVV